MVLLCIVYYILYALLITLFIFIDKYNIYFFFQGFEVSLSVGFVISSTLLIVLGNYWKRRKYLRESVPVIKHFSYDKKKANTDIPSGNYCIIIFYSKQTIVYLMFFLVSSFRIFRTSHRSLSPSIKSTNRQTSIVSSIQDSPNHQYKSTGVKYTAPQQLGVMGMFNCI